MSDSLQFHGQLADPSTALINAFKQANTGTIEPPCPLFSLPNELLLQIIEDPVLKHEDVKSLALSSSRFFYLARPRFYTMEVCCGFNLFESSFRWCQVSVLRRCLDFGGASALFADPCPETSRYLVDRLAANAVLECLMGKAEFPNCLEKLKLLFNVVEDYRIHIMPGHECDECNEFPKSDPRTWVLSGIFEHLEEPKPHGLTQKAIEMIEPLTALGALMPKPWFHTFGGPPDDGGSRNYSIEVARGLVGFSIFRTAMHVHTPVSLLELMLRSFQREGILIRSVPKLLELHGHTLADVEGGAESETIEDFKFEIRKILRYIYAQNFAPQKDTYNEYEYPNKAYFDWEEAYYGEAADVFEAKIRILNDFDVITIQERDYLESKVVALRKMYDVGKDDGFDLLSNGQVCWGILMGSVPFPFRLRRSRHWFPPGMKKADLHQRKAEIRFDLLGDSFPLWR